MLFFFVVVVVVLLLFFICCCCFLFFPDILFVQRTPTLTLILLFTTNPTFANSVDPDQMASEEAI